MNEINATLPERLLHWIALVCALVVLFSGVGIVSTVQPKYLSLISVHKLLGISLLGLVLVRIATRLGRPAPSVSSRRAANPLKALSRLLDRLLYALLIALPLLGWGMLSAGSYPVELAPGLYLPPILPQSDTLHTILREAHAYLSLALLVVILLELAAALSQLLARKEEHRISDTIVEPCEQEA